MNKYGISEAKSSIGFKTYAVQSTVAKTTRSLRDVLVKGAVFVTAFSMVFSVFSPAAQASQSNKIEICHATSSQSNPYVQNSPDKNGTVGGHSGHNGPIWFSGITQSWGDIIPSFNYWNDGWQIYPGKNWNAQGQAIWDADCKAGTLTLIKVVEGGNAPVSDWTLSADGTYDFSGASGTASVTNVLVPAKQYTLSESGPGGYDASLWTCKDNGNNQPVTVTNGNKVSVPDKKNISCTIINTKQQPRVGELTLVKIVSGGNEQASAWTLYADGVTDIGGTTGSDSVTDAEVLPGTYTLSESGPQGYTGIWSCVETSDKSTVVIDDNQIVIEAGDDIICTVTNTYTPDPEVPLLHIIKVVCDEYEDVYGNKDADKEDDTVGKYTLFKNYPNFGGIVKPVSPNEIPKDVGCSQVDGWKFKLATDLPQNQNIKEVGPTTGGEFVTPISGEGSALTEAQQEAIRDGQLWISEVEQPGYGFATIRCYNYALNGDNLEYITLGNDNPGDIYCIAYNVPIDENPSTVDVTIIKYLDDSLATPETANNTAFPMQATWDAENIGAGSGTYELDADGFNGDPTPYQAITSQMTPGASYSTNEIYGGIVGETCDAGKPYTLEGYGVGDTLEAAVSDEPSLASPSFTDLQTDKFVIVRNLSCHPPVEEECESLDFVDRLLSVVVDTGGVQCSISGFKYRDVNGNGIIDGEDLPVPGWQIYLNDGDGGCTYDSGEQEPTVTTDEDGKYEFTNLPKGKYYVCERQQNGWDQVLPANPKYHEVTLSGSSVKDINFLNTLDNDKCEVDEPDYGFNPESKQESVESISIQQYNYSVSGCKFYGDTDERLAGWRIYIDLNKNGILDGNEPYDDTDSTGYYKINFLSGDYSLPFRVREVLQSGWEQTYPVSPLYHELYLGYKDQTATGIHFRNIELPEPCKEPVTVNLASGSNTDTAGSTTTNPSVTPLAASSYEGSFGDASTASPVIPPWVDPTTGSFAGSGAVWVSTSTDHPGAGDEGSSTVDQWRLFEHKFNIPTGSTGIEESTLYFTADNAVTVYLNGTEIADTPVSTFGANAFPVDANFDDTYSVNFTPTVGDNTLSFVVRNSGGEYGPSNPTGLLYATDVTYTPKCDDTPPGGGGDSSSTRSGSRTDRPGRVLGDSTGLPYQAPQVLGATTELPRTGTPLAIAFSLFGLLAIIMIPKFVKIKN